MKHFIKYVLAASIALCAFTPATATENNEAEQAIARFAIALVTANECKDIQLSASADLFINIINRTNRPALLVAYTLAKTQGARIRALPEKDFIAFCIGGMLFAATNAEYGMYLKVAK